jgi:hypothetical protein
MATANPVGARGPQPAILDDRRYKQYASLRDTEFTSKPPVCTENLIRVDDVMESPKLAE